MDARKKEAPNVFELLAEIDQLKQRLAAADERLKALELDDHEVRLVVPKGFWESEIGRGTKDAFACIYTAARETGGYACFSDRELGRRIGIDRRTVTDLRVSLRDKHHLIDYDEIADYNPRTGVYRFYVPKAHDAWHNVKRKLVKPEPQQTIFDKDEDEGLDGPMKDAAQPLGSVDSPRRQTPTAADERNEAAVQDEPPPAVSSAAGVCAHKPPPGAFVRTNPPPPHKPPPGAFVRTNPPPPDIGAPARPRGRAGAPDTNTNTFQREKTDQSAQRPSVPPKKENGTESVTCQRQTIQRARAPSAQEQRARAPSAQEQRARASSAQEPATIAGDLAQILQRAIDPEACADARTEEHRIIEELIRLGGVAADGGRLCHASARKVAAAVRAGWIDWQDDVLRLIDDGVDKCMRGECPAPWVYLIGTMPRLFAERERPWKNRKPR